MRTKTCWEDLHREDEPAVEVRDLAVYRNDQLVLEGVSFALQRGEALAVVGPNGAGKTTLLSVIAGLIRPSSGKVRIFGHPPGHHLCLGYLPQRSEAEWNFPAIVLDVVLMGRVGRAGPLRRLTSGDLHKAEEALHRVGLAHLARRPIRNLSGGEQQRMLLARALAQEARILLLDEPLAGLDAPAQNGFLSLLRELAGQGLTVLVALHELDLVAQHFSRALLLRTRPIALGDPRQILTPQALRTAYGTALHLLASDQGLFALGETCCPKGEPGRP